MGMKDDIHREVSEFAAAHADFQSVKALMAMLLHAGHCNTLQEAYEIAKAGATTEAIAAYRQKQRRAFTAAKRRAAFVVIDGGPTPPPAPASAGLKG